MIRVLHARLKKGGTSSVTGIYIFLELLSRIDVFPTVYNNLSSSKKEPSIVMK